MKHPLHFPKCSCTQPSREIKKVVTTASVLLNVHAGDLASTMASLHVQSRGNRLPMCCTDVVTMGPLCITDTSDVPCFLCKQLCLHTSSASKVCQGRQEFPLLTSAQVYSACLPFELATLSFAPGLLLGKGILHKGSATFWHGQGPGAFSHSPSIRQLRKLIQDHQCPPPGQRHASHADGRRAWRIAQIPGMSAPHHLATLPCWLPPQRLHYLLP